MNKRPIQPKNVAAEKLNRREDHRSGFYQRRFWLVSGPYPVLRNQGRWGFERRSFANVNIMDSRIFEIFYGYNPRCCFKGTWGKPGTFSWKR